METIFLPEQLQFCEPCAEDLQPATLKGAGRCISTYFDHDFGLDIIDDYTVAKPRTIHVGGDDWYILSLRVSGHTHERVDKRLYSLGAYTCSMVHYVKHVQYELTISSDVPLTDICVIFRSSVLARKLGCPLQEIKELLHPEHKSDSDPWFNLRSLTPAMERVIADLLTINTKTPTYRLIAEAKTLELLALYIAELQAEMASVNRDTARCREGLNKVKCYLEEHYREDPDLNRLASMVGFNRRKLTEQFKATFGKTVREYNQELRMEKAKALLQHSDTTVTRIADGVGYDHQSNFAKAFRQKVGMTPRAYRAQRQSNP